MKFLVLLLSTFYVPIAFGQTTLTEQQQKAKVIRLYCKAPEIIGGQDHDTLLRIEQRLSAALGQDRQHHIYIALVNSNVINAWAVTLNMTTSLICLPVVMAHFMGDAEGELAFIISHEIGHALDDVCKNESGRLAIAQSRGSLGAFFGGLLGGAQGAAASSRISQQRGCEARADEIGFVIFTAAGYNPYDAAGAFGRLEMYMGDTSTGILARLSSLGSDHPMTPDRIKHMRMLLMNYAAQNSGIGN
jgi:predicted Zn-dependent protease